MEPWTIKEVMAFYKVSRSTIYRRMASGKLPFNDDMGVRRFSPESIIENFCAGERVLDPNLARQERPRQRERVRITGELLLDLRRQA